MSIAADMSLKTLKISLGSVETRPSKLDSDASAANLTQAEKWSLFLKEFNYYANWPLWDLEARIKVKFGSTDALTREDFDRNFKVFSRDDQGKLLVNKLALRNRLIQGAFILTAGLGMVLGVVACMNSADKGGGNGVPGGDDNDDDRNLDALCTSLVNAQTQLSYDIPAYQPAIDQAVAGNLASLERHIQACDQDFRPVAAQEIKVGGQNGAAVALNHIRNGEIQPWILIAGSETQPVDLDYDGEIDDPVAEAFLLQLDEGSIREITLDQNSGAIDFQLARHTFDTDTDQPVELDGQTAKVTIVRNNQGGPEWVRIDIDGAIIELDLDQLNQPAFVGLRQLTEKAVKSPQIIDQINAFDARRQLEFNFVPGIDLGLEGESYGLPESIRQELNNKGYAPILGSGNIAGAMNSDGSCGVMVVDKLVSGGTLNGTTDGIVKFNLASGVVDQQGFWDHLPAPDGFQCVGSVAKEGNVDGFVPGTVVLQWFNAITGELFDQVLPVMWEDGNQAEIVIDGELVTLTIRNSDGSQVLAEHQVDFSALGPDLSWLTDEQRNAIPKDAAVTENDQGQIVVNGQPWYEPDGNGGGQETIDRLINHAQYDFWTGIVIDYDNGASTIIHPVNISSGDDFTVEEMILGGKHVFVRLARMVIPDMNDSNLIKNVFCPIGFFDDHPNKGGKSIKINGYNYVLTYNDEPWLIEDPKEFMKLLKRGGQIEVKVLLNTQDSIFSDLMIQKGVDIKGNQIPQDAILPCVSISLYIKYKN